MRQFLKIDRKKFNEIIVFAMPAIFESILVTLLTTVDTYMLSSLGTASVAAVALTTQPMKILMVFFTAINTTITKNVAECMGMKDKKTAAALTRYGLILTIVLSISVAAAAIIFADSIMALSGSNPDSHNMAVVYYRIIMAGMIPCNISLYINAVKRGMKNSKVSLISNIASNILNVLFDYILIFGAFGIASLGIMGAALATDIGYVAAMIISIWSFNCKKDFISFTEIMNRKEKGALQERKAPFMTMTVTLFVELILTRIAFMLISAMTARLGTTELAVDKVAMNFLDIVFSFGSGLQAAAITMIGKNLGENDHKSIAAYTRTILQIGFIISVMLFLLFITFGDNLIMLYFEETKEISAYASMASRMSALIVLVQIPQLIMNGVLRGLGQVKKTLVASVISVLLIQAGLVYVFLYICDLGLTGKWIAAFVAQTVWVFFLSIMFLKNRSYFYQNKASNPES